MNVLGAVNGIRAAVSVMRPQRTGAIVLTASVAGITAWSHAAPYCKTKAAVIQLAKVATVEYAHDGIRVNCVCPGTFLSAIHEGLPQDALDAIGIATRSGSVRRPTSWRVLVPRERRVALDDRFGDRRRRWVRRRPDRGVRQRGERSRQSVAGVAMPCMKISAKGRAMSRAESRSPGFSHR